MQQPLRIHDKQFAPYLDAATITERIKVLAGEITAAYSGLRPLFIGVLNGAFLFAADLFRNLDIPAEITFVKLSSYAGTSSSGNVVTAIGLDRPVAGRHLILLEDIIDTGRTLHEFIPSLHAQRPASVRIATLLSKPQALQFPVYADYTGFEIPDKFVVGYGLDYDGFGRNLPAIYQLAD